MTRRSWAQVLAGVGLGVAVLGWCAGPAAAQASWAMEDLGTLGGAHSEAYGVSADGSVVVGWSTNTPGQARAFRWTDVGGMQDLGTLGGDFSFARSVSGDGSVVVGHARNPAGALHAYRWTATGGMQDLGTLGGSESIAYGVSADGSVVVGWADNAAAQWRAFRWTAAGGMQDLGTLGGAEWHESIAHGVSADGSVVVGWADNAAAQWRAFRWTAAGGMQDLGTLGGAHSQGYSVSADGSVVGGWADNAAAQWRAFRWTATGGMQNLGTLGGAHSQGYSVSADGSVVVGRAYNAAGPWRAFRWTAAGGMQDFGTLGGSEWYESSSYGVSADGSVVVGSEKYLPDEGGYRYRAFRWTLGGRVVFADPSSTPIVGARVYAYRLVNDDVEIIDEASPVTTDEQGFFAPPAAFAEHPDERLGLLARVTYTDPGSRREFTVTNYLDWDYRRPATEGAKGTEVIRFPVPAVLQGGWRGGTDSWLGPTGSSNLLGDYLLGDPALAPKNNHVDTAGRRVPAFLVFTMPSSREQSWGFNRGLPFRGGAAHEQNAARLNDLITVHAPAALATLVPDVEQRQTLPLYLVGHSMGGLITRAWLKQYAPSAPPIERYISLDGVHGGTTFYGLGGFCKGFAEWYLNGWNPEPGEAPTGDGLGWSAAYALANDARYLFVAATGDRIVHPHASALALGRTMRGDWWPRSRQTNDHVSRFLGGREWAGDWSHAAVKQDPTALEAAARWLAYHQPPAGSCPSPTEPQPCALLRDEPAHDEPVTGLFEAVVQVEPQGFAAQPFAVDAEAGVHVELLVEGTDAVIDVQDGGGISLIPPDAEVTEFGGGRKIAFSVDPLPAGTYTVTLSAGEEDALVLVLVSYESARLLALELPDEMLTPGSPAVVRASMRDQDEVVIVGDGGVVQITITLPDETVQILDLFDDGAHHDGAAGDGLYGNAWPDTGQWGRYCVHAQGVVTLDGHSIQRSSFGQFVVASAAGVLEAVTVERLVLNDGGLAEWLEIDVEVSLAEAGNYQLRADLRDAEEALIASPYVFLQVAETPETITATLPVPGSVLLVHGEDGPWTLTEIQLVDVDQVLVLDTLDDYVTEPYQVGHLAPPGAPVLGWALPAQGPRAGGNAVLLNGANLLYVENVLFNGVSAPWFEVRGNTVIEVTAPVVPDPCVVAVDIQLVTPWHDETVENLYGFGPILGGDLNCDDLVNIEDFALFVDCMAGPDVHDPLPGCDPATLVLADLDGDGDVDLADFAVFEAAFVVVAASADLDGDGDVDLDDFVIFAECLGGPNILTPPPGVPAEQFTRADLDGDGDVDLADFAVFAQVFGTAMSEP